MQKLKASPMWSSSNVLKSNNEFVNLLSYPWDRYNADYPIKQIKLLFIRNYTLQQNSVKALDIKPLY